MARFEGPVRFRYKGDPELARQYIQFGRVLLGQINEERKRTGLPELIRNIRMQDGVEVRVRSGYGENTIEITKEEAEEELERAVEGTFVTTPISDEAPNGWGLPFFDEDGEPINPPLGTAGGGYPQTLLQWQDNQESWRALRYPQYRVTWPDGLAYGNISWAGITENFGPVVLSWTFAQRYRWYGFLNPLGHIYYAGRRLCTVNQRVIGAFIFDEFLVAQIDESFVIKWVCRRFAPDGYPNDDDYDEETNPLGWRACSGDPDGPFNYHHRDARQPTIASSDGMRAAGSFVSHRANYEASRRDVFEIRLQTYDISLEDPVRVTLSATDDMRGARSSWEFSHNYNPETIPTVDDSTEDENSSAQRWSICWGVDSADECQYRTYAGPVPGSADCSDLERVDGNYQIDSPQLNGRYTENQVSGTKRDTTDTMSTIFDGEAPAYHEFAPGGDALGFSHGNAGSGYTRRTGRETDRRFSSTTITNLTTQFDDWQPFPVCDTEVSAPMSVCGASTRDYSENSYDRSFELINDDESNYATNVVAGTSEIFAFSGSTAAFADEHEETTAWKTRNELSQPAIPGIDLCEGQTPFDIQDGDSETVDLGRPSSLDVTNMKTKFIDGNIQLGVFLISQEYSVGRGVGVEKSTIISVLTPDFGIINILPAVPGELPVRSYPAIAVGGPGFSPGPTDPSFSDAGESGLAMYALSSSLGVDEDGSGGFEYYFAAHRNPFDQIIVTAWAKWDYLGTIYFGSYNYITGGELEVLTQPQGTYPRHINTGVI